MSTPVVKNWPQWLGIEGGHLGVFLWHSYYNPQLKEYPSPVTDPAQSSVLGPAIGYPLFWGGGGGTPCPDWGSTLT